MAEYDIASLKALRKRVQATPGPDIILDEEVARALGGEDLVIALCASYSATATASIDRALKLVKRVMPNYKYSILQLKHGFKAYLTEIGPIWPMPVTASAATAPLALMLCLLDALIARATRQPAEAGDGAP